MKRFLLLILLNGLNFAFFSTETFDISSLVTPSSVRAAQGLDQVSIESEKTEQPAGEDAVKPAKLMSAQELIRIAVTPGRIAQQIAEQKAKDDAEKKAQLDAKAAQEKELADKKRAEELKARKKLFKADALLADKIRLRDAYIEALNNIRSHLSLALQEAVNSISKVVNDEEFYLEKNVLITKLDSEIKILGKIYSIYFNKN